MFLDVRTGVVFGTIAMEPTESSSQLQLTFVKRFNMYLSYSLKKNSRSNPDFSLNSSFKTP